jgi:hypothetical protein
MLEEVMDEICISEETALCAKEVNAVGINEKQRAYKPPLNPPPIIVQFRDKGENFSSEKKVALYYEFVDKIQNRTLDISERISYCQMSLSFIEALIKSRVEDRGRFDCESIPAIELAVGHFAKQGVRGQLLNIRDIVFYFPELEPWRKMVEDAIKSM